MFKTETHLHTSPVSSCAKLSPEEMIRAYKDKGYTTVFVSDHFSLYHYPKGMSFKEYVDYFIGGYTAAKRVGDEIGICVLFSVELTLNGNHYLLYGADKEFLLLRPDIFEMPTEDFYAHAKAHGVTVIQAHPYRDGKCFPTPASADGIEALNANPRHENFDEKCLALAKEYRFPITAGSDAHREEDIGVAAMLSDTPITSVEQYVSLLFEGKLRLRKGDEIL